MPASPKQETIPLQLLHHIKARTLPFSFIFQLVTRILHIFLQSERKTQNLPWGKTAKYLELFFSCSSGFLHCFGQTFSLAQAHKKKSHGVRSRLNGGHCCSSTPNPPTSKMVFKPGTNRKRKICWCSKLYEVQFLTILPLRNNGQRTTLKHNTLLKYLL